VTGSGDVTPVTVKTADLKAASATAEAQESQLVQVSAVKVAALVNTASPSTTDAFWAADDDSSCSGPGQPAPRSATSSMTAVWSMASPLSVWDRASSSMVGVVNGFKNDHTLEPRSSADLVP